VLLWEKSLDDFSRTEAFRCCGWQSSGIGCAEFLGNSQDLILRVALGEIAGRFLLGRNAEHSAGADGDLVGLSALNCFERSRLATSLG